jgi:FtsP/CotA-like multicopper oxidase with cupredoxin domain
MDTHPIHLHRVQFQLIDRQDLKADAYAAAWQAENGTPPLNQPTTTVPLEHYLIGTPIAPDKNETGWKDTIRAEPMQVTRIRVRFAPQSAPVSTTKSWVNYFPFDPTLTPGYVWHCHLLDHEDNEMMRPFRFRLL